MRSRLWRTAGSSSATSRVGVSGMLQPLDRQRDGERRPRAGAARPMGLAAMLLGDLTGDREPEPGALGFGGEELLEEATADVLGDAGPGVAHCDLHRVVDAPGGDGEAAALGDRLHPTPDEDKQHIEVER